MQCFGRVKLLIVLNICEQARNTLILLLRDNRDKILLPLAESKKKLKSNGQYGKVFNDYYNKCKSKC